MNRPKKSEKSVLGEEPVFEGELSKMQLANALNWYSYFCEINESKKWLIEYMESEGYTKEDIRLLSRHRGSMVTQTMCSIARILLRGGEVDNTLTEKINAVLEYEKAENEKETEKPIQKDIPNALLAKVEEVHDEFILKKYKANDDIETALQEAMKEPKATEAKSVVELYTQIRAEIENTGKDKDYQEGYSFLNRAQRKRYLEFIDRILDGLKIEKEIKRRVRKPRTKSKEQILKGIKYLEKDDGLNVASIDPAKFLGKSILWTYNVKTRKLTKYMGDVLSLKGTTLQGFDAKKSYTKTIRKPEEFIPPLLTDGKAVVEKKFKAIKAKPYVPNGRINDQTLLIRTFK